MPFAKEIQRAEQAARQQEQRERETLAQKKQRGKKNETSKPLSTNRSRT